jgi:hypothetical protein
MTTQQTDVAGLAVLGASAQPAWSTGTSQDGVDERVELARIEGSTGIAVRDAQYPAGPALLFSLVDWNALLGRGPDVVDLR